jgi:hypothetical protein
MSHTEAFLDNFRAAVASHEPDRVADCLRTDCRFDQPVHPARSLERRGTIARAVRAPRAAGQA